MLRASRTLAPRNLINIENTASAGKRSMRLSLQRGRKNSIEELEVRMEVILVRRNKRKGLAYREGAVKVRTIFRSIET